MKYSCVSMGHTEREGRIGWKKITLRLVEDCGHVVYTSLFARNMYGAKAIDFCRIKKRFWTLLADLIVFCMSKIYTLLCKSFINIYCSEFVECLAFKSWKK